MKKIKALSLAIGLLLTQFAFSAQFYWVGGSGNWSDFANHWATTSGGSVFHTSAPGAMDTIYIDNASFLSSDTLFYDVGTAQVAAVEMSNLNNPVFLGGVSDVLSVSGGLSINMNINHQFLGNYIFNGLGTNTIIFPDSLATDITFNGAGIYTVSPFVTQKQVEVIQGDIIFGNVSAESFICTGALSKNLSFSSLDLTGSGLTLDLSAPNTALTVAPTDITSSYSGNNSVQFAVGTLTTGDIEFNGTQIQLSGLYDIATLEVGTVNLIELTQGTTIKPSSFLFNGSCASYKRLEGLGTGAFIDNSGSAFSFDYINLKNIEQIGGVNDIATNSVDLGGVSNITISSGAQNFYWKGGQGNWSDASNWSTTDLSFTPTSCLPGPSDTVIFNGNSGLSFGDTLFFDLTATVSKLDFSLLPTNVVLSGSATSITVRHMLDASTNLTFDWNGDVIFDQIETVAFLKMNGTNWGTKIIKRDTNTLLLEDDFETSEHFVMEQGTFDAQSNPMIFDDFYVSPTLVTQLDFSNAQADFRGDTVSFNSASLSGTFTASKLELFNPTTNVVNFFGGAQFFDTVVFSNTTNNAFNSPHFKKLVLFPSNNNIFESNSTFSYEILETNSDCSNRTSLEASNVTGNAAILSYTGAGVSSLLEFVALTSIDADTNGGKIYNLNFSDTVSSGNWTLTAGAYYWINNAGSWSDVSHWSATSGGTPIGCIPSKRDTVIFDLNSFSLPNQTVIINIEDTVKAMLWESVTNNPILFLDTNFHITDDLVLNNNMSIESASLFNYLGIEPDGNNATIKTNNCVLNTQLLLLGKTLSDTISLKDNYTTFQDSIGLTIGGGTFLTNGFDIKANTFSITFPVPKKIDLDSSSINLSLGWVDTSAVNNLIFDAGTSSITIDSALISQGFLLSKDGLAFNNVDLFYTTDTCFISGNNSYNNLVIHPQSRVAIQSNAIQTVNGKLTIDGACSDSISLFSDMPGVQTNFVVADSINASVLNIRDVNINGALAKTFFSSDLGNNSGWIFDTTPVASASLSLSNDYCLGDTTLITNSFTSVFGNPSDFEVTFDFGVNTLDTLFGAPDTNYQVVFFTLPDTTGFVAGISSIDSIIVSTNDSYQIVFQNFPDTTNLSDGIIAIDTIFNTLDTNYQITFQPYPFTTNLGTPVISIDTISGIADTTYQIIFETFPDTTSLNSTILSFDSLFGFIDTNYLSVSQIFPDTNSFVFESPDTNVVTMFVEYLNNGCKIEVNEQILIRDPAVIISASSDTLICSDTDVIIGTTVFPFNVNYDVFRNGVSIGSSANDSILITDLVNNDDFYIIADDAGCLGYSDTLVFNVVQSPTVNMSVSETTICDGIPLELSVATADSYRYFKNGIGITSFVGDDTLTVTSVIDQDQFFIIGLDSTGCRDTSAVVTINVNPNPVIALSSSDADNTICFGDQVTFTPSGAIDYDFLANGVSQTGFVTSPWVTTALTNGQTVSVVGRDANGCVSTAPQSYTHLVNVIPTPTISTNDSDISICAGDLVQFTSSGAAQYQFFVNGNSFAGPSGTTFTSTSSLTNNDEVYVVGTSNNCSGFSDTIVYEVIDLPNLVFTSSDADNTICQGDVVDFTATGGTTYQFTLNGSIQQTNTTGLYSNANLNNGQVVTVEATQNGCSIDQSITTTVNPKPSVNLFTTESDFTICEGETITFNASNATTYEFFVNGVSQGAPSTQNSFNPSTLPVGSPEVYVVGYNSFDCFDISDTITITVNALPVVGLASSDVDNVICENESVVFTASGAAQYQFFVNGASQGLPNSNNQFTTTNLLNTDTISVLGNTLGCSQLSLTEFVMTVNPNPTVSLSSTDSDNIFCEGDAVTITASGATNYEFFLNTTSTGIASTQNIIDASTLTAGAYVLDLEGEALGCVNTSQLSFTIFGGASVNLVSSDIDNTVCAGETVQFTGSGATLYEFFVNGNTQGSPSTNPNFNATGLVDGDAVSVNASTAQGCSALSNTIVTTVLPTPSVNLLTSATTTSICQGDQVTFTATGAIDYTFLVDGVNAFPSGNVASYTTDTLSTGQAISVIGSTGQCSATSTTTFSYTVFDNPVVSLINPDDNNLCVGEASNLIASGANNYQFSINGIPQGALSALNTFTTPVNDGDQITVTGESNNCISTAPQTVTYTVIPFPTTTLSSSDADNVICLDESVTFTANGASTYTFFVDGIEQVNTTPNTLVTSGIENGNLVAVVGFNGDCQTTAPTSFTFTVNEMDLDVSALPSNYMICEGESFEVTATGGDTYEFFVNGVSQGPLSPTATFISTNLIPGDFVEFLAANNTTGCIQNYSNTIYPTVIETPVLTANGPTTFCENDSVVLLSNVQGNIEWYLDGGLISNETDTAYIAESTGTYYFDLTSGGNNEVYAVGFNANGELGVGNNFNTASPTQANNITDALVIDAGDEFGGSITVTGELFMWGQNNTGQLGNGTFTSTNNPILITGVPPLSTLSLGSEHAVVVTNTGAAFAWGQNDFGQLGIGNTLTVNTPQLVTAVNNIVEVASGKSHTLFLRNDGTVWSVGNNDFGQLGNGTLVSSSVPAQIGGLTDVASIQVGEYHSIAITTTGNVFVWGNNTVGQLGLGDLTNRLSPTLNQLKDIVDADGGATHTLLLNEDGEVFATGGNAFGQLGTGDQLNRLQPELVAGLNGVQTVSAGQYHSLALKQDFSVWGYGRNVNEQLGALATTSILNATQLNDAIGVTSVSAGKEFTQFIFGLSNTCSSNTIAVDELPAPVPVITLSNGSLVSSETADSYQWFVNGVDIVNSNSLTQVPSQNGNYVVETTYSNGCTQASSPYVFSNLGLDELNVSVQVYPNPVRGLFQVVLSQGQFEEVSVLDVAGRLIYTTQEQTNKLEINAFNWEKGVYIVRVNTKNSQIEKRIIKQ